MREQRWWSFDRDDVSLLPSMPGFLPDYAKRGPLMLHRRLVVRGGLAALGTFSLYGPIAAFGQNKPMAKVRYNEVVRSVLYAPAYTAITKGYFKDAGIDVELSTGGAGDKTMAALLSGSADIALAGPETAIYVLNSDSLTKARIFCGLTSTDG